MRTKFITATVALAAAALAQNAHAGLVFSIEGPQVEASTVPGVTTENFDSFTPGSYSSLTTAVGTFDGGEIVAANEYGGAGGTNYWAVGAESNTHSQTLTLTSAQDYLGLWWSAGDASNILTFFDGATVIGTYNVAEIIPSLSSAYFGNPSDSFANDSQPYDYLNFTTTGSTVITSVEFTATTFTAGFEVDNISVLPTPITPPGQVVPETSSTFALLLAVAGLFAVSRRHRQATCA
ncbi:MAG TPA: hypothetical protein VGL42_11710 [Opitutaceae bacterium]|jgi:hypothetical protein